jgi:lysophospholipase L1-like esterase
MLSMVPRILLLLPIFVGSALAQQSATPPKGEPSDAKEAAEKKVAADRRLEERYQAVVATLSPAEQAWERVLQGNLGAFYLPIHKGEKASGKSNAWDFVAEVEGLPRVLLIGDSVSRGYTQAVRKELKGVANVHRAPENCGPVANGLRKLDVWLGDKQWDLIHFNFGIHDRATPPADYAKRLEELLDRMEKSGARIVWASTTPIPDDPSKGQKSASIVERNALAAGIIKRRRHGVDDLFSKVAPSLETYQNPNDVHFNPAGYDFLGVQVAESIRTELKSAPAVPAAQKAPAGKN